MSRSGCGGATSVKKREHSKSAQWKTRSEVRNTDHQPAKSSCGWWPPASAFLLRRSVTDELVGPLDEILHVRRIGVSAVMLTPRQLSREQTLIHRWHLRRVIISFPVEALDAKQRKHPARIHRRHEAPLMIEPMGVALLRNPIADKRQPGRTQRDELIRIDRNI